MHLALTTPGLLQESTLDSYTVEWDRARVEAPDLPFPGPDHRLRALPRVAPRDVLGSTRMPIGGRVKWIGK